jgi:subtilisin family serine protease
MNDSKAEVRIRPLSARVVGARTSRLIASLTLLAVASAALSGSASAAPPVRPELNPLFAAEWWLRGHTTVIDWSGEPRPSDGVDAVSAWPSSTGEGVVVAVADSGVDAMTPALRTQMLPGRDFLTGGRAVGDPLGHGTQVATLIAGNPQQSDGIFGVAPGAQILPLRVATARGHVPARAAAAALAYAARHPRIRVINMSWHNDFSPLLERALASTANSGRVLLVSSAGNDARDLFGSRELPQTFDDPSELTVASTDMLDRLSWFSNYGLHVDVAAPGERILSAYPGGTLTIDDGTSMAAPIVSGVAALLLSHHAEASAAQVKRAILSSCTPVPELAGLVGCGGIVNAPAALATLATILEQRRQRAHPASPATGRASRLRTPPHAPGMELGDPGEEPISRAVRLRKAARAGCCKARAVGSGTNTFADHSIHDLAYAVSACGRLGDIAPKPGGFRGRARGVRARMDRGRRGQHAGQTGASQARADRRKRVRRSPPV